MKKTVRILLLLSAISSSLTAHGQDMIFVNEAIKEAQSFEKSQVATQPVTAATQNRKKLEAPVSSAKYEKVNGVDFAKILKGSKRVKIVDDEVRKEFPKIEDVLVNREDSASCIDIPMTKMTEPLLQRANQLMFKKMSDKYAEYLEAIVALKAEQKTEMKTAGTAFMKQLATIEDNDLRNLRFNTSWTSQILSPNWEKAGYLLSLNLPIEWIVGNPLVSKILEYGMSEKLRAQFSKLQATPFNMNVAIGMVFVPTFRQCFLTSSPAAPELARRYGTQIFGYFRQQVSYFISPNAIVGFGRGPGLRIGGGLIYGELKNADDFFGTVEGLSFSVGPRLINSVANASALSSRPGVAKAKLIYSKIPEVARNTLDRFAINFKVARLAEPETLLEHIPFMSKSRNLGFITTSLEYYSAGIDKPYGAELGHAQIFNLKDPFEDDSTLKAKILEATGNKVN